VEVVKLHLELENRSDAGLVDFLSIESTRDQAFDEVVRRHGEMVLFTCRRTCHNSEDVQECYQKTFFKFMRDLHMIREPEKLSAWLHHVATCTAKSENRSAASRRTREQRFIPFLGTEEANGVESA